MESIVDIVDGLIAEAAAARASDIHLDPSPHELKVRFRIDGVLQRKYTIPKHLHAELISRIKVLAHLRTDEHQATQDGRFRFSGAQGTPLDVRVSIAPTFYGENVVLRLLTNRHQAHTLESLGFNEKNQQIVSDVLKRQSGMILSTGPTGSGKTTTLYTLLSMRNTSDVSIITIEDPIEYAIEDVKQLQVNSRAGLTFANGLRSILRQDPNIIMVGEIRDMETASIAVNTALSGHLLLSTLHTNNAATTLPRLLDMGVDAYLVASTISLAIGQRLVRTICTVCKDSRKATEFEKEVVGSNSMHFGRGCEHCSGSGYTGRLCMSEILVATDSLRDAIIRKASAKEIEAIAIQNGMITMREDGLDKVRQGYTTLEEVLRVMHT
jgi:type IV pilus assembly protein PilB